MNFTPFFKSIITVIFFVLLTSCKTKEVSNQTKTDKITFQNKPIEKTFYNSDKSLLLILSYTETMEPSKKIHFKVIDSKTKDTILKDVFIGTKLEWHTKNSLKGHYHIGIVQQEDNSILEDNKPTKNDNSSFKIIEIKN